MNGENMEHLFPKPVWRPLEYPTEDRNVWNGGYAPIDNYHAIVDENTGKVLHITVLPR